MRRILLVEDEIEILRVEKQFLERNGFEIVAASAGRRAIDMIASGEKVDLAVLDVKMPDMTGFDCLKEIRKIKPDLPALFLTGSIDKSRHVEVLKTLNCEPDDVLQKPIDLNELIGHIKEKLGG